MTIHLAVLTEIFRNNTWLADKRGVNEIMKVTGWRLDYRNESEYPDPETTTYRQFAWEFLRRNPRYQQFCDIIGLELFDQAKKDFFIDNYEGSIDDAIIYFQSKPPKEIWYLLKDVNSSDVLHDISKNQNSDTVEMYDAITEALYEFSLSSMDHYSYDFPFVAYSTEPIFYADTKFIEV